MADSQAIKITVNWNDGLKQEFERQRDSTWNLTLSGQAGLEDAPAVSGYDLENMGRVLKRALEGTKV